MLTAEKDYMYKSLFELAFRPVVLNTNISLDIPFIKLLTIFIFLSKTAGILCIVSFGGFVPPPREGTYSLRNLNYFIAID